MDAEIIHVSAIARIVLVFLSSLPYGHFTIMRMFFGFGTNCGPGDLPQCIAGGDADEMGPPRTSGSVLEGLWWRR